MRKLVFILILTTSWLISSGQLHKPVQPLNESGYTLAQFEAFASNSTEYSASYREKLLSVVNHFLAETGLYKNYNNGNPLNESWISWIFYPNRTYTEWRVYPNGFRNTRQSFDGRSVEWFWDKRRFEGLVTTLHLEGYELDLGKTVCTNLVDVPYKTVHLFPPQVNPAPEPVPDRFIKTERDDNQFTQSVIIKKVQEGYVDPNMFITETIRTKTWFGRNWGYVAGFVGASALTTGGIIWYNNRSHHSAVVIEPRTMPPGIPATPAPVTPGLPSDPRNMPGGTGMNFNNTINSFQTTDHAVVVFKFGR